MSTSVRFKYDGVLYTTIYGCQRCLNAAKSNIMKLSDIESDPELLKEYSSKYGGIDTEDRLMFYGRLDYVGYGPMYGTFRAANGSVLELSSTSCTFDDNVLYDGPELDFYAEIAPESEPDKELEIDFDSITDLPDIEEEEPEPEASVFDLEEPAPEPEQEQVVVVDDIELTMHHTPAPTVNNVPVSFTAEEITMNTHRAQYTPKPYVEFKPDTEIMGNKNNPKLTLTIGQDYDIGVFFAPKTQPTQTLRRNTSKPKQYQRSAAITDDIDEERSIYTQPLQKRTVQPVDRVNKVEPTVINRAQSNSSAAAVTKTIDRITPLEKAPSIYTPSRKLDPTPFIEEPEPEQEEPEVDEQTQKEKEFAELKKKRKEEFRAKIDPEISAVIGDIPMEMLGSIVEYTNEPVAVDALQKQRALYCVDHRWKKQGNWFCIDVIPNNARYFFNPKRDLSMEIKVGILKDWKTILESTL